jgi:hypothetical protein
MPPEQIDADVSPPGSLRAVGIMVAAAMVVALVAMLHHPVSHGRDADAMIASIVRQAPTDRLVHGALSIVYGLIVAAMLAFAQRLGLRRFPVLLGAVGFSSALVLIVLAVMIDGFVAPAVAEGCAPAAACTVQAVALLRFGGVLIEYLTRFGFAAIAVSVICWGLALIVMPGALRWAGAAGLAAGLVQVAALAATPGRLTPSSLLPLMAGQFAWYAIAAVLMIGRRAPFGPADLVGVERRVSLRPAAGQ